MRFYISMRCKLGESEKLIHETLQTVCGDCACSYQTGCRWVKEFNEGKESLSDCPCPGQPKSCVNEQTIASIKEDIEEDLHIFVRELSDTNGLSYGTVHTTITEHLRMKKVKSKINEQRPKVSTSRTLLLHVNAGPHKARATTQSLRELGIQFAFHLAYSPDLAACDFWLFSILKDRLAGRKFDRIQDLAKAVNSELRTIQEEDYQGVFRKRQIRLKRCIESHGECFEGLKTSPSASDKLRDAASASDNLLDAASASDNLLDTTLTSDNLRDAASASDNLLDAASASGNLH
ncbi:transposase [Elysia marginata]|uniref:Transposase n=1 Tax=Elysia marginata TaxID=1093978 RepID=A0AAV4JK04_9GAST|nr:transposase [Elysia marginata]